MKLQVNGFTGKRFSKIFKKEIKTILYKTLLENRDKTSLLFHKANIILIAKPDKDITRKEN